MRMRFFWVVLFMVFFCGEFCFSQESNTTEETEPSAEHASQEESVIPPNDQSQVVTEMLEQMENRKQPQAPSSIPQAPVQEEIKAGPKPASLAPIAVSQKPAKEEPEAAVTQSPEDKNRISLDAKGMDIVDVLQLLAKRTGMNVVIGKDVTGRVTLFLKDVDINDAFDIILLSNNLAQERKGDIVNIMTQREYELLYGSRYQDKKQVKIIHLRNAKAADLASALNLIKSNMGRIVVDETTNTVALIDSADKIKELEDFIQKTDLPLQTKIFALGYATVDKIQEKIRPYLSKGVGNLQVDERTNKIMVTDYPNKLAQIETLVAAFDEKMPQVLIDAQIIEVNPQKDQFAMGVDWDYWINKNMRFAGSLPAPTLTDVSTIPNKFSFGVAAANALVGGQGHYKGILDMLSVIGETKILSSPRIMVLNNQEAKILVGTKEAYITSSTSQTTGSSLVSQTVNFVDVGIKLYVTPTISHEGFITMKIKPEVSSSKRTDITSEGKVTQIPIVTTSETETTIRVKDGMTIIIAGLKKDSKAKEVKKIPLLGDIPLLGLLFRNIKEEVIKTELVIFITPRIVTGEEAIAYTSLTKDKDIESLSNPNKKEDSPKKSKRKPR